MKKRLTQRKSILILIFIFILILVIAGIFIALKKGMPKESPKVEVSTALDSKDINYQKADNISYAVGSDYVDFRYIQYPSGSETDVVTTLPSRDYPKLFKGINDNMQILIKPFTADGKLLYVLANVGQDHGGITYYYGMVMDIFDKNKVLYETNNTFGKNGFNARIWAAPNGDLQASTIYNQMYLDRGRSDGYELIDFLTYDKSKNLFVTNNINHKEEITKILDQIKKTGKDETVTEQEYSKIVNTYEDVLNGKEESILDIKF